VSSSTISRSGPKVRVFVSSVVDGFEEYREAARRGIEAAGATPVMVNEDFPSQITSSRNACLEAIESSDCIISVVGERGGWTAPSGRLVVEEEFEHAKVRNLPVLAFVQDTRRDISAERFVRRLSDYLDGNFRTKFRAPAELQKQVESAIRDRVAAMSPRKTEDRDLSSYLAAERRGSATEAILRLVLVPERDEEVIDPVRIASDDFKERLLELGHTREVHLFTFSRGKSAEVQGAELVIEQDDPHGRHHAEEYVRLQLAESGLLILDGNVTGRTARSAEETMVASFVVAIEDVEAVLAGFFRFSAALYSEIDPHQRHERFYYNAGLRGLGHRSLERNPQPRGSFGASMRASDDIAAFPSSRLLSRAGLKNPRAEIERALALLERKARE
jgi:hypothetical protein